MSLKLHITGSKIRYLKSALQFLARVGADELTLEAVPDTLVMRSINSSKSAYASVNFHAGFFDAYQLMDTNVVQAGITMKHALALFRSQCINKMTLEHKKDEDKLSVTVLSENGLQKQYRLPCLRIEVLQAAVDDNVFPVCVIAAASELNRLLASFQTSLDEITINAIPACQDFDGSKTVQIHSYVDPGKENSEAALRTQLDLDAHKIFLGYDHAGTEPSDVTFNLKDFKAMLSLCEALSSNVAIRFDGPGNPLVVKPHNRGTHAQDLDINAVLVLATLRSSQFPAGTSHDGTANGVSGRALTTHNAGERTPNVPGDTPWHVNGEVPSTSGRTGPLPHQPQTHMAPREAVHRPSRFAQHRDSVPPQPRFEHDTPFREAPVREEPPSGRTSRPSARFFDSETEYGHEGRQDAGAGAGANEAGPSQAKSGQPNDPHGMQEDFREQPGEEGQGDPQWWELEQQNGELSHSLGQVDLQDDDETARLANMPPLRSRYRAMLDDDDDDDDDEEAIPGTPPA